MAERPPYRISDLLLLLGQCTVELAWLRGRVAELEASLEAPNGRVTTHPEEYVDAEPR